MLTRTVAFCLALLNIAFASIIHVPVLYDKTTNVIISAYETSQILYGETISNLWYQYVFRCTKETIPERMDLWNFRKLVTNTLTKFSWPQYQGPLSEIHYQFSQIPVPGYSRLGVYALPVPATFYDLFSIAMHVDNKYEESDEVNMFLYSMTSTNPIREKFLAYGYLENEQWDHLVKMDIMSKFARSVQGYNIRSWNKGRYFERLNVRAKNYLNKVADFAYIIERRSDKNSPIPPELSTLYETIYGQKPKFEKCEVVYCIKAKNSAVILNSWPRSLYFFDSDPYFDGDANEFKKTSLIAKVIKSEWNAYYLEQKVLLYTARDVIGSRKPVLLDFPMPVHLVPQKNNVQNVANILNIAKRYPLIPGKSMPFRYTFLSGFMRDNVAATRYAAVTFPSMMTFAQINVENGNHIIYAYKMTVDEAKEFFDLPQTPIKDLIYANNPSALPFLNLSDENSRYSRLPSYRMSWNKLKKFMKEHYDNKVLLLNENGLFEGNEDDMKILKYADIANEMEKSK
ncbi:hypothetical protein O9G_003223 [Rozella allomycis CSF55]|uniref:Uncharacterized protein n=1 Tax=Rozella allomycis (strain CSF55) TaxID=988480 RepID=A0A075AXR3_ROZAC|nr:hypothetical protein O9G_003223 [Rozella allomycis CSF55]|eukprot:EPZ35037.1 hypothetical protein O9G_003223 [Rozella allomycis CSF55]